LTHSVEMVTSIPQAKQRHSACGRSEVEVADIAFMVVAEFALGALALVQTCGVEVVA